jgi:TRAP-type C4-dicarboxylate transport system substrate-binding protein
MKKLVVLGLALTFVFGQLFFLNLETVQAQTINLKFAHFWSPVHNQHKNIIVPFAEQVGKLTNGKVKIKVYPGRALGGPKQLPDAVKSGVADMALIYPFYIAGRYPRSSVLEMPFLFNSSVQGTKVIYDIYDKYLAGDYPEYKMLWFFASPPLQLHSITKPIKTLNDVKGMKLRAPSAYGTKLLKALGSNPVGMPGPKIYMALEKGVIDGLLTVNSAITDLKLVDLIKYSTQLNIQSLFMAVIMNKKKYNSLPDDARRAIDQASGLPIGVKASEMYDEESMHGLKALNDSPKASVYTMPAGEKAAFSKAAKVIEKEWINQMTAKGLPAKEMVNALYQAVERNR